VLRVSYFWEGNGLLKHRNISNKPLVEYTYDDQQWRIETETGAAERHYTVAGAPTQVGQWNYGFAAGEMVRPTSRLAAGGTTEDFLYDDFGNLAAWIDAAGGGVDRTYTYDGANRLASVDDGGVVSTYLYSVDNELMEESRDGVVFRRSFSGWTWQSGTVYESLLPMVTARDGELLYVLKELDGRSNAVRRLDGTLVADDSSGVYGQSFGQTTANAWPLDELHGSAHDSSGHLMHFGARHMIIEDGRWLQPEPLLYMGVTNGNLQHPLAYGPVYARGNSNLYADPSGEFASLVLAGGGLTAAEVVALGVAAYAATDLACNGCVSAAVGQAVSAGAQTAGAVAKAAWDSASELVQNSSESPPVVETGPVQSDTPASVDGGASQGGEVGEVASPEAKSDLEAAQDRGATTTTNEKWVKGHLEKHNGVGPKTSGDRIHEIKDAADLGGADDLVFDLCGGCYDAETGEYLGSLTDGGAGP
jgi:YD repeat-containing protein